MMKKILVFFLFFGSFVFGQDIAKHSFNRFFKVSDTLEKYEFRMYTETLERTFELYQIKRIEGQWLSKKYVLDSNLKLKEMKNLEFKDADKFWIKLHDNKMHMLQGIDYVKQKIYNNYDYFVKEKNIIRVYPLKGLDELTYYGLGYETFLNSESICHKIFMASPRYYLKKYPNDYEIIMFNRFLDLFEQEFNVKFLEN